MKKLLILFVIIILIADVSAQSPGKMSYQAVIRNIDNQLVANQKVGMKISIIRDSFSGSPVYIEIQTATTNSNGLATIEIGGGTVVSGDFGAIDWADGPYFLKTETDPAGATNYILTGTSQILSVPYAFYAETAGNGFSGDYNDLSNKPELFSGSFSDLTDKPSTVSGYGITDAMTTSHAANAITATQIATWDTAFGWGNHAGLYRPLSYVPAWNEITNKPTTIAGYGITDAVATSGDQSIAGVKAFTGTIKVPTPMDDSDAATKAYVDVLKALIDTLNQMSLEAGNYGTLVDIDMNVYKTIKIGTQVWMAENLKTTKLKDGTTIPNVADAGWSALTTAGRCYYNNDSLTFKSVYGALYNWYAVNTGKLCPSEWHVPSDQEWKTLSAYLDGNDVAGGKLKETGTTHWITPNTGATNETGFTAVPGGFCHYSDGHFGSLGESGSWWSSSESSTNYAYIRGISNVSGGIFSFALEKRWGYSVRCIRN